MSAHPGLRILMMEDALNLEDVLVICPGLCPLHVWRFSSGLISPTVGIQLVLVLQHRRIILNELIPMNLFEHLDTYKEMEISLGHSILKEASRIKSLYWYCR